MDIIAVGVGTNTPRAYALLATAVQAALEGNPSEAARLLSEARKAAPAADHEAVSLIAAAVASEISLTLKAQHVHAAHPHNEFGVVHYWFKTEGVHQIPGAVLVPVKRRAGKNPDFMVLVDGEERPVECKLNFNARALNQLRSYLDAYGASHGYAVAPRLTCELPSNITFIERPMGADHV